MYIPISAIVLMCLFVWLLYPADTASAQAAMRARQERRAAKAREKARLADIRAANARYYATLDRERYPGA